jgi:hypothetical protein
MKNDHVPDWPQPQGIFESGTSFNPMKFLSTVCEVYSIIVLQGDTGNKLSMKYEAFVRLLQSCTIINGEGCCLFKLFALEMPVSTPSELFVNHDGLRHMILDCLCNAA